MPRGGTVEHHREVRRELARYVAVGLDFDEVAKLCGVHRRTVEDAAHAYQRQPVERTGWRMRLDPVESEYRWRLEYDGVCVGMFRVEGIARMAMAALVEAGK